MNACLQSVRGGAVMLVSVLLTASIVATATPTLAAQQPPVRWEHNLVVEAPTGTNEPFKIHVDSRLIGPQERMIVPSTISYYSVLAIQPDGSVMVVGARASIDSIITGQSGRRTYLRWPEQNGEWTFQ